MKKLLTFMMFVAIATTLSAQAPFTKGNIVVLRVGDGNQDLTKSNAASYFLDEFKIEDNTATFVQSVPLPTEIRGANKRCVAVPSSVNMGMMTRSADGRFLVIPGYDGPLGVSPWGKQASDANRVVALVNSNAGINTTTALTNVFNTKDHRSATSYDGTDIWVSGNNSTGNPDGGVFYTAVGGTTGLRIGTTHTATRYVKIYDGQLYISVQERIYAGGTGMPKTSGNVYTDLTEAPNGGDQATSGYGFFIGDLDPENPGTQKVMYFADANGGKIKKYSLVSGTWTLNGDIAINKPYGLEGIVENGVVKLFAVSRTNVAGGDGKLWLVEDASGYNQAPNTTPDILVDYTGSNKTISSVAWAPVANSLLPIKLTSFTAQKQQNAVRLSWSTASETNNSHFEVLRSDGEVFQTIGMVQGNGTTTETNTYNFTDNNPLPGISYYQLRQVDFNGKSELSKIIPVNIEFSQSQIRATGRSNTQHIEISVYSPQADRGKLQVTDVNGKKIAAQNISLEKGNNQYTITANLSAGVYIATAAIAGKKYTVKFISQ